jgi:adenine/guanine phosphoribosyltransferase-like PRPP-binding protein
MKIPDTNLPDPEALALSALGWTLSEEARAERLLALTGLTPADLRTRLGDPEVLAAILGFLEAHEPDLIACAEAIGTTPATLVDARRRLER